MTQPRHAEAGANNGFLLPLIGVAVALGLWLGSEDLRERIQQMQGQLAATAVEPARNTKGMLAAAERNAGNAHDERTAIETGLQSAEPLELLQTRFLHVLRQRCQASGATSCVVKFSSESNRTAGPAVAASAARSTGGRNLNELAAAEIGIDDLGLAKARAVVTGSFQGREMLDFVSSLSQDKDRVWRFNGLVVRANNFELDVEQIVKPSANRRGVSIGP